MAAVLLLAGRRQGREVDGPSKSAEPPRRAFLPRAPRRYCAPLIRSNVLLGVSMATSPLMNNVALFVKMWLHGERSTLPSREGDVRGGVGCTPANPRLRVFCLSWLGQGYSTPTIYPYKTRLLFPVFIRGSGLIFYSMIIGRRLSAEHPAYHCTPSLLE